MDEQSIAREVVRAIELDRIERSTRQLDRERLQIEAANERLLALVQAKALQRAQKAKPEGFLRRLKRFFL